MNDEEIKPSNYTFVSLGTVFLWVSWLFFNGGSTLTMFNGRHDNTPRVIMNTMMAAGPAGIVAQFLKPRLLYSEHHYEIGALCNGILVGLISVTGAADSISSHVAILIGVIGGFVYILGCKIAMKLEVDDPVEAWIVHGCGGMWGVLATGFFHEYKGLIPFQDGGEDFEHRAKFFGVQVLGIVTIIVWTVSISLPYFLFMRKFNLLRISQLDEILGDDIQEMGEPLPKFEEEVLLD